MSIRDRGTKKWTSIMMPEQIEMLKEVWKEQDYKEKPILDEQALEDINIKIHYAIHEGTPVEITYFSRHDYHKVKGTLLSIDLHKRKVRLDDSERTEICLDDIIHIS